MVSRNIKAVAWWKFGAKTKKMVQSSSVDGEKYIKAVDAVRDSASVRAGRLMSVWVLKWQSGASIFAGMPQDPASVPGP